MASCESIASPWGAVKGFTAVQRRRPSRHSDGHYEFFIGGAFPNRVIAFVCAIKRFIGAQSKPVRTSKQIFETAGHAQGTLDGILGLTSEKHLLDIQTHVAEVGWGGPQVSDALVTTSPRRGPSRSTGACAR